MTKIQPLITNSRVSVLIPTRNKSEQTIRCGYLLESLLLQTFRNFRVVIRDEGAASIFSNREVRQFIDLLTRAGIPVQYHRVSPPTGIAAARRELVALGRPDELLCFVDDDMCLAPDAIQQLLSVLAEYPESGFVQGQKIEADSNREYWNDINQLNGRRDHDQPFRIYFGDTALLLIRSRALEVVNWDLITHYHVEGLTGEDVALSIMIADKFPCHGAPKAIGYHLSPAQERWIWEAPSDLLQVELLRGEVRTETLRKALPHLAEYI